MQLMRSGSTLGGRTSTACRAATAIPPKVRSPLAGEGEGLRWRAVAKKPLERSLPIGDRSARPPLSLTPLLAQFKTVKPSGDRVLVKVDKEEGRTQGGVLLPTVAQNKPTAGAVVALGDVELVKVRACRGCV